jgi:plasmid stabilization system protein ParE
MGLTGIGRDDFGDGLRSFVYRERVIYFTIDSNSLYIVRVLHGHQHVSRDTFISND